MLFSCSLLVVVLSSLKQYDVLTVVGVWKHIYGLYLCDDIVLVEHHEVACLCGGVAADIHYLLGSSHENGVDHILVHTCSWRVGDDDIGSAVSVDEVGSEQIFHVAGEEECVVDMVELGVDACVAYSIFYILDTYALSCLTSHEVGYRSGAGIEVIDQLVAL